MAPPPLDCARATLSYPLYACDFDPHDPNRLVVGGGGGATKSGVGNKITVVDTSSKDDLRISGEVDLSRDEDSVWSLAVGPHRGKASYVYAGVNSSPDDVKKGKNEHFRVLSVEGGGKSRASTGASAASGSARITELSRQSLFITKDANTYQRLVRLSAPFASGGGAQLGAVATGIADHQIALFDVATGSGQAPKARGIIDLSDQAVDLDVIQTGPDTYLLAYCTGFELWLAKIGKGGLVEPELVYTVPHDESSGAKTRPEFRAMRFLSPGFILTASNLPKAEGVLIQAIRLPSPKNDKARLAVSERLPKSISKATALAVRNLSTPDTPTAKYGDTQFVLAVVGHNGALLVYTLEHRTLQTVEMLANLTQVRVFPGGHPQTVTGLALSPFIPPSKPTARAQFVKLASISAGSTVAVHAIPLKKFVDRSVPLRKGGPPRPVRYTVAARASNWPTIPPVLYALAAIALIMAVVGQAFMEMYGQSPPILHAQKFLPSWHGTLRNPKAPVLANQFLASLVGDVHALQGDRIVLREEAVSAAGAGEAVQIQADVHDEEVHGPATTWEDLSVKQQEAWKKRLKGAGHWAENMGESVFKGILFGELAGAVGRAVAG